MPEKAYNILIITIMLSEFRHNAINNGYVTKFDIYFWFSIIIFALYIICTASTNIHVGIIINVMCSAQSHGANATISRGLHGTSLCLVTVVNEPWNIQNTPSVLSLAGAKRYLQAM